MTAHPFKRSIGPTIAINAKLFSAVLFGFAAWLLWPSSLEWWGFGVLSILVGLASVMTLIDALKSMARVQERDKVIADFEALGQSPKSSRMASEDALKEAGMLDG